LFCGKKQTVKTVIGQGLFKNTDFHAMARAIFEMKK
jgi:hypothetical protein